MTPPLILTDLDDTLFQTKRKCVNHALSDLYPMSVLCDGSPSGYATPQQQSLLRWFQNGRVVPVTARSREVLARVAIARAPAICSHGGCIIRPDGSIDTEWQDHILGISRNDAPVQEVYAAITSNLDPVCFRHWIVNEAGIPLYIVIKTNVDDEGGLHDLGAQLSRTIPTGWRTHRNGNNIAFLPPWLNKRYASEYFITVMRRKTPDILIIGVGDSLSDAGFMDLCDFAMTPTRSQFWDHAIRDNEWIR